MTIDTELFDTPTPHWYLATTTLFPLGLELTLRVPADEEQPPQWALVALERLASFVELTNAVVAPGQVLNLKPMLAPFGTQLAGVWFVNDVGGQHGSTALVQAVGVTDEELRAISSGHSHMVGTLLLERSQAYLTELDRESVVKY